MMLRELEKIVDANENNGITEVELQQTAAALRARQFIWKDKHGQGRHYDLLIKFQDYYKSLFSAFGDEFFIEPHFGYCGIIPRASAPRLRLLETVFLLILAKLHDAECRKACSENGRTMPSESLLVDEYCAITGKERPKAKDTRDALKRLQRAGVIELGEFNENTEMATITLLPSIMRVVSNQYLDRLAAFSNSDEAEASAGDELTDDALEISEFEEEQQA